MNAPPVPELRVRAANDAPLRPDGAFVLYWMTSYRRPGHNFALDRAVEHAARLSRSLFIVEPLRVDYPYASDRIHRFVLEGMADHVAFFADRGVTYHPYVERQRGESKGMLAKLATRACVVVTDDHPGFFVPRMIAAAAAQLRVRLEAIDGNGLVPIRAAERTYERAVDFRRHIARHAPVELERFPDADPLLHVALPQLPKVPRIIEERWPRATPELLAAEPRALAELPIDHDVGPVPRRGGFRAGRDRLARFIGDRLRRYEERKHPDANAASGLSPYLHFGHVSTHEILRAIADDNDATRGFREQLLTWRELAYHTAARVHRYDRYESLPAWARTTLDQHRRDPRDPQYDIATLVAAATHDEIWNAAQRELMREGSIHNYLRMLWGKKILEWTASPEEALQVMFELNDRYAIDGRDPNSVAGITWVLGRYDRPFGERPITGKLRPMTSPQAKRKLHLDRYLERYGK